MALTRKFLSALGIETEKIDEIIQAHADTVDALKSERDQIKSERDQFQADAKKLEKVQKELDDLKNQDETEIQSKYDALKKEFETYKSDQEKQAAARLKEDVYTDLLKNAGVSEKRIKSILKVTDLSSLELDESGKAKNAADVTKAIQTDWADFIESSGQNGVPTPKPPANGGTNGGMTKKEILAIKDGAKRRQAIAENPSLFNLEQK